MSSTGETVALSDLVPDSRVAFDVGARRIARVYAEALLEAAEPAGLTQQVFEELVSLVEDVFAAQPDLETYLLNPAVGREPKADALRRAFAGKASDVFLNFLLVLNNHGRLDILRPLVLEARLLLRERKGQQYVIVRTAVPLPDDLRQKLIEELRQTIAREPVLVTAVDPDMIGGITVRVGDWLYDASVRTKLNDIRTQLFESSAHEIQTRRDRFRTD
jgi:ATP synthase F1 delta subunit